MTDELAQAKQRIAELEATEEGAKIAFADVVAMKEDYKKRLEEMTDNHQSALRAVKIASEAGYRAGFEAAKKAAVKKVPANWLDPALKHMLGGGQITQEYVEIAMRAVSRAIAAMPYPEQK